MDRRAFVWGLAARLGVVASACAAGRAVGEMLEASAMSVPVCPSGCTCWTETAWIDQCRFVILAYQRCYRPPYPPSTRIVGTTPGRVC